MNNTDKIKEVERLNEIIDGVSRLPLVNQEYVLAVIRAMAFTRNTLLGCESNQHSKESA